MANLIKVPHRLNVADIVTLNAELWDATSQEIEVDFTHYDHSSIFALTFLTHQFRALQFKKNKKVRAVIHEHMTWARGMNFFSLSGSDWAARVTQIREGDGQSFIPITHIDCRTNGRVSSLAEMNEEIDRQAVKLTNVLLHFGSGPAFDTIQYAFREIIRNIYEHSGARGFLIARQFYPSHRDVQIVIADDGMGIPESLRGNTTFKTLTNAEALNMSLMPGVSGNERAVRGDRRDIWQNSGYGLYMMTRLARNRGIMTVFGNDCVTHINNSEGETGAKTNHRN